MSTKATVTREEIQKIAQLAKLHLSDDQLATYTEQINEILEHVRTLEELDLSGVEPLAHVLDLVNVSRADEPGESLPREQVLTNTPIISRSGAEEKRATDGEFVLVPGIIKSDT